MPWEGDEREELERSLRALDKARETFEGWVDTEDRGKLLDAIGTPKQGELRRILLACVLAEQLRRR